MGYEGVQLTIYGFEVVSPANPRPHNSFSVVDLYGRVWPIFSGPYEISHDQWRHLRDIRVRVDLFWVQY